MPAPDINHISDKPVFSSLRKKADNRVLIPTNEYEEGVSRSVTTRIASVSYKNLFPGQIYPLTAVMIEYE